MLNATYMALSNYSDIYILCFIVRGILTRSVISRRVGDAFVGLNATVSRGTESHFRLGIFLSIHRFLNYIDT